MVLSARSWKRTGSLVESSAARASPLSLAADAEGDASPHELRATIVRGHASAIEALRLRWNELLDRCERPSIVQSYTWCRTGFEKLAALHDIQFAALLIERGDSLVALWPFTTRKSGGLVEVFPLGSGGYEEYGGPLYDRAEDERELAWLLAAKIRELGDLIRLFNLPEEAVLTRMICAQAGVSSHRLPTLSIHFDKFDSFDKYMFSLSKRVRVDSRYQLRRLEKHGATFVRLEDPDETAAALDWLFTAKLAWVRANRKNVSGYNGQWLMSGEALKFLKQISEGQVEAGELGVFVIRTTSEIIAAGVCLIEPVMIQYYYTAYSPAWADFSPGKVLTYKLSEWAFQRGANFDFRQTTAAYKESWSNHQRHVCSVVIATNGKAMPIVWKLQAKAQLKRLRTTVGHALPPGARAGLKRLLRA